MSARQRMTMRATVERKVATLGAADDQDGFGQETLGDWRFVCFTPCWCWSQSGGSMPAMTESGQTPIDVPRMAVPLGTDIRAFDRINTVADRRQRQVFGLMAVDGVTIRRDHLEVSMRNIG